MCREVRTLSAEGRLSAYILVALPVLVFCFLAVFRPDYISNPRLQPRHYGPGADSSTIVTIAPHP